MRAPITGLLTLLPLSVLAACGPTVKHATPNHVTIESYQMNAGKAQQLADAECAKYNRTASLTLSPSTREDERTYIFSCVD